MNIAIIGNGRMGKAITHLAESKGHSIVYINNGERLDTVALRKADVAIEFTQPNAAYSNIQTILLTGIPVVCGTTGWLDQRNEIDAIALDKGVGFLYASNFSLGVNLFFLVNEKLAKIMAPYQDYSPSVHEIHHTGKKDKPSGTAITTAEGITQAYPSIRSWTMGKENDKIEITSERIDSVCGTHRVHYHSSIDTISLQHEAHSRDGFAIGALIAAEWVIGKRGSFGMRDVLGL
jgi:4-hydroxy-tetrahydrodipicolinate reductase